MAFTCIEMPSRFGEESKQEVKDAVKPNGSSYTWEELAKYNERHNAHVAVWGKVNNDNNTLSVLNTLYLLST